MARVGAGAWLPYRPTRGSLVGDSISLTRSGAAHAEPLYETRKAIVTGKEEAPAPAEGAEALAPDEGAEDGEEVPAGVPEFWLNVLRNCEDTAEQVRSVAVYNPASSHMHAS